MTTLTCGFIGLGLIGGSIAKALRQNCPDTKIIAFDVNKDTLARSFNDGTVTICRDHIDKAFLQCDFVFLCAPVEDNAENLLVLKEYLDKDCILTDVGSVKSLIHEKIHKLSLENQFIGGHPMAGSERFGYSNSKAILLENAYYVLTPAAVVPEEKIAAYSELVSSIGAIPLVLEAGQHDYVTGAISHLPHIIASSLVNLVKDSDSEDGIMKMIAAGGFKDITRIASSSPEMWQQICLTNTENILTFLDRYILALSDMKSSLLQRAGEDIYTFFEKARVYRDSFIEASSGPIKKSFSISVDIADETGALASIATLLALKQISIKNIGIVHNRELAEGALRIEFYEEAAVLTALSVLKNRGYIIHEK